MTKPLDSQVAGSASELTANAKTAGVDSRTLRQVFEAKNQIIHELDIDLKGKRRKRRQRTKKSMLGDAETLLSVGEQLIQNVAAKLGAPQVPSE